MKKTHDNNLVSIFFKTAKQYPNHVAIQYKKNEITYEKLARDVIQTSHYYREKGIKKGDKVLLFIPMSISLYTSLLALFSLGAIVVFVDQWSDRERLKKALEVVPCDVLISKKILIWLGYVIPPFTSIKKKLSPKKSDNSTLQIERVLPNDTALITFTTGSTGLPKAADRTHKFLTSQFNILKDEISALPNDKCLITLPIVLLSILGTGATGVISTFNQKKPDKLNTDKELDLMLESKVSLMVCSPFYIEKLLKNKRIKNSNLRRLITGGAPIFPALAKEITTKLPQVETIIAYGSTEAEPISVISAKEVASYTEILSTGLPVGKIHPSIQCKIIRYSNNEINVDLENNWSDIETDEVGEIIVTGTHVLDRYFNSDKAFRLNKISDGNTVWHRTGDGGKLIKGHIYLFGRISQIHKIQEQRVSPFLFEYSASLIEGISKSVVIKNEDKFIACIELDNAATNKNAIEEKLQKQFPYLDEIQFIESIPRDPRHHSKVDLGALKQKL